MADERLFGMLGLAMRAGKVVIGTEQVCLAMPRGRVKLVLVSAGASEGTRKKLRTKCEYYGIKSITVEADIDDLGRILGKTYSPACVGIADEGFAAQIERLADQRVAD